MAGKETANGNVLHWGGGGGGKGAATDSSSGFYQLGGVGPLKKALMEGSGSRSVGLGSRVGGVRGDGDGMSPR